MRTVSFRIHVGLHTLAEAWGIRPEDLDPLEQIAYSRWDREVPAENATVKRLELAGLVIVTWSLDERTWIGCVATPRALSLLSSVRTVRALPSGMLDSHACR